MKKNDVCPYCGGTGQIKFISDDIKHTTFDKQGKSLEEFNYYTCFCINNKVVSKSFNKLSGIPDITPEQAILAGKFAGFRNLLIHGNEQKFLHLVKATLVLHANYHRTFEFLNGIELVHKYYVEQPDGVHRFLSDLEEKNLVIFIFDASPENKAQNTTVLEVVKNRIRMNNPIKLRNKEKVEKPTWIYSMTQESLKKSKEYSVNMEPLLENFTWVDLENYKTPFEAPGYETNKKRSSTQDAAGDL